MASSLSKELIYLILQFLDEEKFKEALHKLEQESGLYFNFKHFEELVMSGNWDEVEKYLSGFTKIDDNRYSMKIYFEIGKQKYLEALDVFDRNRAVEILVKDLKVFSNYNEDLFRQFTQLLTLENFRQNDQLSSYRDTKTARATLLVEVKKLIDTNPVFRDKMVFPDIKTSRLKMLINQSCRNSNDQLSQLNASNHLIGLAPRTDYFLSTAANGPFLSPTTPAALVQTPISTWLSIQSNVNHPGVSGGGIGFGAQGKPAAMAKDPGDSEGAIKMRFPGVSEPTIFPGNIPGQSNNEVFNPTDDFPKTVARLLDQGSVTTTMDFHPTQHTLLLVGNIVGNISLWEVSSREKFMSRSIQAGMIKRVLWTLDGSIFGVVFSKNIMQLYHYRGINDIRQHLEIDAHVGSVNDLAFCKPSMQLCAITCGDDKTIKVWNVATGAKLYTFEGHAAPVHSVCPHNKGSVHFVFSTSVDGKIKAWLYDQERSRVDYDAPGRSCTTMAYSTDGKRLFSCGTSRYGESYVVEWNEVEGIVKRTYQGFCKPSSGIIQFDTTKNRFLAVGDDFAIKVWDMDSVNLWTTIDAEGYLPASPRIRFNKEGSLLAVSAKDNIKILATVDGLHLMRTYESHSLLASRVASETMMMNCGTRSIEDVKTRLIEQANSSRMSKHTEISENSELRSLRLPTMANIDNISRLIYTNSGSVLLALASTAIHLLWRWNRNDQNLSGKATTKLPPHLMQPTSGTLMTNDLTNVKPEETESCLALSKNDSYVISASGGKITLFNMVSFKKITSFMCPPPVATYLVFHPQDNNIIAVGSDDSTIEIYNVQTDNVGKKLRGHSKKVTGLAFSIDLNTLISSGADSQIISWNTDSWERQNSTFLQTPAGRTLTAMSDTQVQFHQDQKHFLVVHETQLCIYEASKLECIQQWVAGESSSPISHGTFSCDNQLVLTCFLNGAIRIFTASTLQLQCQINPTAYLPANVTIRPRVLVAHPLEMNQFAVGLSDGGVIVLEPLESEGRWGVVPPTENGVHATRGAHAAACSDQGN
ncbi:topless-related protein 1-like [Humulus lupulus]|uniref:topless-related protein 1-like n=1 Tax=Humulus lupulus TaxID=3486 RepID=UPI002B404EB9|nr:topless-related protein 1-like [Humulus lupulus]